MDCRQRLHGKGTHAQRNTHTRFDRRLMNDFHILYQATVDRVCGTEGKRGGMGEMVDRYSSCVIRLIGRVWLWSDLHFGDTACLDRHQRPLSSLKTMHAQLFEQWQSIGAHATMLVAGDVVNFGKQSPTRSGVFSRMREMPGAFSLVAGNHDIGQDGRVDAALHRVADNVCAFAVFLTTPILLVTHVPLGWGRVPPGCVNVHGHLHQHVIRDGAHINITVEQLTYQPVSLDELVLLAQAIQRTRTVVDGHTTTRDWLARI